MDSLEHLELALEKIRPLFERARQRIDALVPGERLPATKLAADIAAEVGMTGPSLYITLKFLLEDYPGHSIKRGAKGGIEKSITSLPIKEDTSSSSSSEDLTSTEV